MGIRGLQGHLERHPDVFYAVDLKEQAARHKQKTGCQPVLVVDLMSILNSIYSKNKLDWICGGQFRQYWEVWKHLLDEFSKAGIELVFVSDGTTDERKRPTWVKRRYDTMIFKVQPIIKYLKEGCLPSDMNSVEMLPNIVGMTKLMLKLEFDCEVITSLREADYEIVEIAHQRRAMGILAQDTDFLIYQTAVPYFSAAHLNFSVLTTKVYDREQFAANLGICSSQLPLLAVLIGNDKINRDEMLDFHQWLTDWQRGWPKFDILIRKLANFIVDKNFSQNFEGLVEDIRQVAVNIFRDSSKTELLLSVLKDYYLAIEPPFPREETDETWSEILQLFKRDYVASKASTLFHVMIGEPFDMSTILEDWSGSAPAAGLLWEGPRARLWGALLYEKPGAHDNGVFKERVVEWCMTGAGSLDEPYLQTPVFREHPGLLYLHRETSEEAELERWKLFAWIIHPSMDHSILKGLEPAQACLVCCLYVMQRGWKVPVLQSWEVDVFILTLLLLNTMSLQELAAQPPIVPDPRGVSLVGIFTRNLVFQANYLAGGPLAGQHQLLFHHQMDGLLFQSLYIQAKRGANCAEQWPHLASQIKRIKDLVPN